MVARVNVLALAGAGVLLLLRKRRRKWDDSRDDASQASFTTSITTPPLAASPQGRIRASSKKQRVFSLWDYLALLLMLASIGLTAHRKLYDIMGICVALLIVLLASRLAKYSRKSRKRRQARALLIADTQQPAAVLGSSVITVTPDMRLQGKWIKDNKASDPMDTACDIMGLHGIVRLAVGLVKGVELTLTPLASQDSPSSGSALPSLVPASSTWQLEIAVFSVISWFKIRERYILNGPTAQWNRRDLRRGKHTSRMHILPDGGMRAELEWGPPYAGRGYDEFRLESADELHVTSHIEVGLKKHTYTIVYKRAGR